MQSNYLVSIQNNKIVISPEKDIGIEFHLTKEDAERVALDLAWCAGELRIDKQSPDDIAWWKTHKIN